MAGAGEIKDVARAAAAQSQKAVVTIRLVVKMKIAMMGQSQDQEQKVEVTGTVIDPSGLAVTDASSIDPSSLVKSVLSGMGGMGLKLDTEVKETLILLDDGTEVEADVVLKDTDLGLAFVRPRDTSKKFDAIALKARNTPPQPLDALFVLGRLGKLANRAATLSHDSIRAVVKGPRSFYVGNATEGAADLGCVAFTADGEPLGLYVMKQKPAAADDGGGGAMGLGMLANMASGMKDSLMAVIRPVNDVIEIAEQAKKAKAPAKTEEAAPEKKPETPAAK
jgi:hypothetical protein